MSKLAEIQAKIAELKKEEEKIRKEERNKALQDIQQIMSAFGIKPSELKIEKNAGIPKYRDANGNTWTGKGKAPSWIVSAEAAGQNRSHFLIAK